jgi:ATP-dependent NAD(P)H-hydrate dehydratase
VQQIDETAPAEELCPRLARSLQNVTIIQKGATDIISNGLATPKEFLAEGSSGKHDALVNEIEGGLKRVGGQGDILSGSTGVLLAWGSNWVRGEYMWVCAAAWTR